MMTSITVSGLVATTPRHLITQDGLPITSFRLACSSRKFDAVNNKWVDSDVNWYTVTTFKQLAINAASAINKGERVIVTGTLKVRDWDNGERSGTSVEIEVTAIGHDLNWGTTVFNRNVMVQATP